ncbi:MAG: segregation and condensation protein [Chloroflexota bacterium]|nr:segregation and condensation protein [Chloroflexota bacterium]
MPEFDITADALSAAPGAAVTPEAPGLPLAAATDGPPNQAALPILLESLLFVAAEPTPLARLAQILDVSQEAVEMALADLGAIYRAGPRGIRLQRRGERVQLTTAPEAASYIERFLGLDLSARLSPAALETLSVIAYKQPLTRADIEAVRGVNCDGVLRTLLARELVEPVGRLEQPGRPFQYGTTGRFLQYLGLESLADLPPLGESSV